VTSLESSFLNRDKTTFTLFLIQGGQGIQECTREAPGRTLRKNNVLVFMQVNNFFTDHTDVVGEINLDQQKENIYFLTFGRPDYMISAQGA
jgi:hypothetical protein